MSYNNAHMVLDVFTADWLRGRKCRKTGHFWSTMTTPVACSRCARTQVTR